MAEQTLDQALAQLSSGDMMSKDKVGTLLRRLAADSGKRHAVIRSEKERFQVVCAVKPRAMKRRRVCGWANRSRGGGGRGRGRGRGGASAGESSEPAAAAAAASAASAASAAAGVDCCPFEVVARCKKRDGLLYQVAHSVLHHTCTHAEVAAYERGKMRKRGLLRDADLQDVAQEVLLEIGPTQTGAGPRMHARLRELGLPAGDAQVLRVLRAVRRRLVGPAGSANFSRLPMWLAALRAADGDTTAELETVERDGRTHYHRCFIAPGFMVRMMRQGGCMRPFVAVECTPVQFATLASGNKVHVAGGRLLCLVTSDAGGRTLPVAVAHVDSNSPANSEWFLRRCIHSFGGDGSVLSLEHLVVSTDGNDSISAVAQLVFPGAHHMPCYAHYEVRMRSPPRTCVCVCVCVCVCAITRCWCLCLVCRTGTGTGRTTWHNSCRKNV